MFRVGMKVVCIDGGPHGSCECQDIILPRDGEIYTIRKIRISPRSGVPNFHLCEINNEIVHSVVDGPGEPYFVSSRFRPIVERKTDISFAHEILRKATKRAPLSAIKDSANVL